MIPPLPRLMVAPNGGRRTKADHPALPVTIEEIVSTARQCFDAGADGIHAHLRDRDQQHLLDAGLYRELIAALRRVVPKMRVQITTEAVGRYTPAEQRAVVEAVMPEAVSVALREMVMKDNDRAARHFYHFAAEAGIAVQHILYTPEEVDRLCSMIDSGWIPGGGLQLLFVLGRYAEGRQGEPGDLDPFLARLNDHQGGHGDVDWGNVDWALCAFGRAETECLVYGFRRGGKLRVGFENGLWNADGGLAADNAERVAEIRRLTREVVPGH